MKASPNTRLASRFEEIYQRLHLTIFRNLIRERCPVMETIEPRATDRDRRRSARKRDYTF